MHSTLKYDKGRPDDPEKLRLENAEKLLFFEDGRRRKDEIEALFLGLSSLLSVSWSIWPRLDTLCSADFWIAGFSGSEKFGEPASRAPGYPSSLLLFPF